MVRCASLFSQLISLFNRRQFYQLVMNHRAERYSKGYSSWDHFVAMLFCQLAQAKSLREICGGLACNRLPVSQCDLLLNGELMSSLNKAVNHPLGLVFPITAELPDIR